MLKKQQMQMTLLFAEDEDKLQRVVEEFYSVRTYKKAENKCWGKIR